MAHRLRLLLLVIAALVPTPAAAQVSTGTIAGRIVDAQGAAVPGVTVQAVSPDTGFERIALSDESGVYRLAALPVGSYDFSAEISGFRPFEQAGVVVNVSNTVTIDPELQLAGIQEGITVTANTPLVSRSSSAVGQVVDLARIQALPINGRQFANLAATVPGVGLGFHSDLTKSAQYTPQISGGNGRNVNYVVDGGDNNDDTVGGLLQLFPLEAIQEFAVVSHRFDAEYGRSNGGVLNVVTKSGTNTLQGSAFTFMRDRALNGQTFTEQTKNLEKQDYRRYQFGGSAGGPIVRDRVHYFAAYERMQQDTKQLVDTLGLFPEEEGIFDVPLRQNLLTAKVTASPGPSHYVSLRYGYERSSQPGNVTNRVAHSAWSTSTSTFHSVNVNHNWVIGRAALNEVVVQYSGFVNDLPTSGGTGPTYMFLNDLYAGSTAAPQRTEQQKWQFRDDFSWTTARFGGLAHELKAGVNWLHEPTLRVLTEQGLNGFYQMGAYSLNAPVTNAFRITGDPTANFPIDLYGLYAQDNWRVSNRLTLNLGVRWDYVTGVPLDQSGNPNFLAMQAAGRMGRFAGTLLDDFGKETRTDKDNVQPRVGAVYDIDGTGRHIVRGGWGIYTDFAYTASNALTAALDAVGAGMTFSATNAEGLRKRDGTLFRFTDPLDDILHLNIIPSGVIAGTNEVVSPLIEQPYTIQSNIGYAHQLTDTTALTVDYVRADGHDLNLRVRPNVRLNNTPILSGVPLVPGGTTFRTALSKGSSRYDAGIFAVRRRMSNGIDVTGSYTLAKATSDVGSAYDEVVGNLIQDINDPFGPVQQGPSSRTDSRHAVTVSAIVQAPYGISVAPIIIYRSALPVHTFRGTDVNADGINNDRTALAYRYTGLTAAGRATFEEDGACETVNCSRRAGFSQVNVRISKSFALARRARLEATAEVFNLFNAKNPAFAVTQSLASGQFMQPNAFAGDLRQPEQRVGQLGLRLTF